MLLFFELWKQVSFVVCCAGSNVSFVSGGCFLLQPSVMTLRDWNGFLVPDTCTCEVLELQRKNGHERDKEIVMDEGPHVYWIQGSSENWTSVTTVIHEYFPEFQGRMIAWRMVKSKYFPHAEKYAKYQDMCKGLSDPKDKVEAILQSWKVDGQHSAQLGTLLHRDIELFFNQQTVHNDTVEFSFFLNFFRQIVVPRDLEPFRTEWMIFSETHRICGSIDMVFRNRKTNNYIMMDWKRSKKIHKKCAFSKEFGFGPCADLENVNFHHYSLQLNLYKFLLEDQYGLQIESMHIVVFHPNNSNFLLLDVPDRQQHIRAILEDMEIKRKVKDMFMCQKVTQPNN